MKIGIITYWNSLDNYGQQLQCYALQKLLRDWGHDAFLIRYSPQKRKKTIWQKIVNHIIHPKYILNHFISTKSHNQENEIESKLKKLNDIQNPLRRFEEFRNRHLKMTEQIYLSYSELLSNPPEADIYITGSDQVWHNSYKEEAIKGYFLRFGNNNTKRISYAASIGRNIHKYELPFFRKYLSIFDAISVRESSARDLCLEQGFSAQVCIDPTLLLPIDVYQGLSQQLTNKKKYAFMYVLNVKTSEDISWPSIKEYLKGKHLELKSVTGSGYYQGRELIEGHTNLLATIPEWIGYIQNAECVFTTSYHGMVFSILMHRPFLAIRLNGKYSSSNSRMEQLLTDLGISERMFNPQKSVQEQMELPINWQDLDRRIKFMRQTSLGFLKKNVK